MLLNTKNWYQLSWLGSNFYLKEIMKQTFQELRGLVSEETVVLRQWGSDTRKCGLSTELINVN